MRNSGVPWENLLALEAEQSGRILGYRAPTACSLAGCSYRQLDYWDRTGLIRPDVQAATGSGSSRLYSRRRVLELALIVDLLAAGISLNRLRKGIGQTIIWLAETSRILEGVWEEIEAGPRAVLPLEEQEPPVLTEGERRQAEKRDEIRQARADRLLLSR